MGELLEEYSPHVVLATASTLSFCLTKIQGLTEYLNVVNLTLRNWFNPQDGVFYRKGEPLEKHCVNTITKFLGRALKELYKEYANQQDVVRWLTLEEQGDKYRLYLFLAFIEEVTILDVSMPFVKYKNLVQDFQNNVISVMFDVLLPHFMRIAEDIEVLGLNFMHERLTLSKTSPVQQVSRLNDFALTILKLME
jgi:hypothetical protein